MKGSHVLHFLQSSVTTSSYRAMVASNTRVHDDGMSDYHKYGSTLCIGMAEVLAHYAYTLKIWIYTFTFNKNNSSIP